MIDKIQRENDQMRDETSLDPGISNKEAKMKGGSTASLVAAAKNQQNA